MNEGTVGKLYIEIAADMDSLKVGLTQAQKAAETAQNKMQSNWANAAQKMDSIGTKMSLGLTAPLVAAGTASVAFAMQAEQSFAKVGTILDETVVSYEDMKKQVTDASNQTGEAVTDLNEALYESISAGVDSGKAIGFTTDMVKLARGGFTETSKAVDVVTSVLNAYGMSADEATKVSDMLITTQNIGKTTVDELASSMGKVIPTANAYKVGLADVSTTMAILTKNGIATAEATTYYNAMLNELGKSGSVADKALRDLSGKGFQELMTSGVPVTEILGMLKNHAADSGKSLADMFGSMEGAKAALTIMKDGGAEYNTVLKQMGDSAGATQKAFDKMDATPLQQLKKSMNEMKNASIDAGNVIIPLATDAVKVVGNLAKGFSSLNPTMQKVIVGSLGIAAAAGPALKIGSGMITTVQKLKVGIEALKMAKQAKDITETAKAAATMGASVQKTSILTGAFGETLTYTATASAASTVGSTAAAGGFVAAGTTSAGAAVGVNTFGAALKAALGPIALIGAGVVTMIGIFSELSKPSEEVQKLKDNTDELINTMKQEAAEFKNTTAEIDAKAKMANDLASKINQLNSQIVSMNAADGASASQKELLKEEVDKLNSVMGKNIITIDEQTGAIKENIGSVYDSIKAYENQARTQVFLDKYNKLLSQTNELEIDRSVLITQLTDGYNKMHPDLQKNIDLAKKLGGEQGALNSMISVGDNDMRTYASTLKSTDKALADAGEEMEGLKKVAASMGIDLEALIVSTDGVSTATKESAAAVVTATDDEIDAMTAKIKAGDALTEAEIAQKQAVMDKKIQGMELTTQEQALSDAAAAADQARLQAIQEGIITVTQAEADALAAKVANNEALTEVEQAMLDQYKSRQAEMVAAASETGRRLAEEQNISIAKQTENAEANTALTAQFIADQDFLRSQLPGMNKYIENLSIADAKSLRANIEDWDKGGREQMEKFFAAQEAAANVGGPKAKGAVEKASKETDEAGKEALSEEKGAETTTAYFDGAIAAVEAKKAELTAAVQAAVQAINDNMPEIKFKIDQDLKLPHFSMTGQFDAKTGGVPTVGVNWYDKGGIFDTPQIIGIAERRSEFVGAAEDLESFISKAVNSAVVKVNPAILYDLSVPTGGDTYGGDTIIEFKPQVTINAQKLTDAELRRATDFVSREFAKAVPRGKVGKIH